jgi:hypothetical protein
LSVIDDLDPSHVRTSYVAWQLDALDGESRSWVGAEAGSQAGYLPHARVAQRACIAVPERLALLGEPLAMRSGELAVVPGEVDHDSRAAH